MYCSTKSYTNLLASIVDMQQSAPLNTMHANQILTYAMQSGNDNKLNKVLEHRIQHGLKDADNSSVALKHQIINDKVLVNLKRERAALNEANNLVLETALSFMKNPTQERVNDESLSKTLQCIKNLNCERSAKIDFVRSTKENLLAFVPDSQKFFVEKQIVSKHREIEKEGSNTQKVVLKSTVENNFNPQR
ncbi:hypothetical protein [Acinetobacter gyllenbergii]|uniref:hypothetical protein n=1 Tax=Acinetobacter gyllenbergii TaxID=134534 RepID=UPI003F57EF28